MAGALFLSSCIMAFCLFALVLPKPLPDSEDYDDKINDNTRDVDDETSQTEEHQKLHIRAPPVGQPSAAYIKQSIQTELRIADRSADAVNNIEARANNATRSAEVDTRVAGQHRDNAKAIADRAKAALQKATAAQETPLVIHQLKEAARLSEQAAWRARNAALNASIASRQANKELERVTKIEINRTIDAMKRAIWIARDQGLTSKTLYKVNASRQLVEFHLKNAAKSLIKLEELALHAKKGKETAMLANQAAGAITSRKQPRDRSRSPIKGLETSI